MAATSTACTAASGEMSTVDIPFKSTKRSFYGNEWTKMSGPAQKLRRYCILNWSCQLSEWIVVKTKLGKNMKYCLVRQCPVRQRARWVAILGCSTAPTSSSLKITIQSPREFPETIANFDCIIEGPSVDSRQWFDERAGRWDDDDHRGNLSPWLNIFSGLDMCKNEDSRRT